MEGITWREVAVRGRNARHDISLGLSKHGGRMPMLRISLTKEFADKHDCNYLAISSFDTDGDRLYFMITKDRVSLNQNKLSNNSCTKQVLFTLQDGEESIIKTWCGKQYKLTEYDKDIYCIEREVKDE